MDAPSIDLPLTGQQVAVVGRLSLLSKRDTRALVEQLGGTFSPDLTPATTVIVTGGPVKELPPHVARVLSEADLCREAGLPDLDTLRSQYYASRDLRGMYPALRDEHLRYLGKWGFIRPVAGRYSFADLHVVRQAAAALEQGAPLSRLLRSLGSERDGQLSLDFQSALADRPPARVVSLPAASSPAEGVPPTGDRAQQIQAANHALGAKYFLEGAELDDGVERNLDGAAAAYRRAVLFDPQLVPALVNLANIHYERDELVEAEAIYEKAIRVDADCFEAYFNLGNIHHDLGRYAEAVAAYRDALTINPSYPEAHFYLAVTLEKLGRSAEARPHWRQYRDLAPDGEFADLAKEFSD
ncbi:MAG TPA: tetratricopeptide repeat protein [Vicinamibacterales bacterium]|nr:tetratricopeptide repeat protein [Vicinamibacterales bacterium]